MARETWSGPHRKQPYGAVQEVHAPTSPGLRSSSAPLRELAVALPMPIIAIAGSAMDSQIVSMVGALATLGVALVYPPAGMVALAFVAPAKPLLVLPAPGFVVFLVAAVLAGWVFRLPVWRPRIRLGPVALIVLGLGAYALAQQVPSMAAGYDTTEARAVGYKFFQYASVIGTALAAGLVLRNRDPRGALVAMLASAVFVALLAAATFDNPEPTGPLGNLVPEPDEGARATGSFGNPNYFGAFIASAAVLALALQRFASDRRVRMALIATAVGLGLALVLSLSRGAIVAFAVGALSLAFLRGRRTGVAALLLLVSIVLIAYPIFVEMRLDLLMGSADDAAARTMAGSDAGRLEAVLTGPLLWLTSPIFGIGFGRYRFESAGVGGDGLVAHNWYMTVLAEQGLVGIALWFLLLVALVVHLRGRPDVARSSGIAVLATAATSFMFLQSPTAYQVAALPVITIAAALVAQWPGAPQARLRSVSSTPKAPGWQQPIHLSARLASSEGAARRTGRSS